MVDYSKWDKFEDSDLDEDYNNNEEEEKNRSPIVHKFDNSKRVKIGPNGTIIEEITSNNSSSSSSSSTTTTSTLNNNNTIMTSIKQEREEERININNTHSWEQTRTEVIIYIPILKNIKSTELKINLNKGTKELEISINSNILFKKEMKYEVDISEDGIDWEVITIQNEKKLKLTFIKHVYIPGSVIWWSCCFIGDNEIDVTTIPARNMKGHGNEGKTESSKQSFADVWKEANEMFRKKIKDRELVDIGDDDCVDSNLKNDEET